MKSLTGRLFAKVDCAVILSSYTRFCSAKNQNQTKKQNDRNDSRDAEEQEIVALKNRLGRSLSTD